jgi:amino acid transporter
VVTKMYFVAVVWVAGAFDALRARPERDGEDRDRGDVPGWVMITVMTAFIVTALLVLFKDQMTTAIKNAFTTAGTDSK